MNKVALVTGASSGIGEATVRRLLAAGYKVYAGARRVERMQPLRQAGAELLALDVTEDASMLAAIDTIRSQDGRLDVLVNNAGIGLGAPSVTTMSLADFRRQQAINVEGVFLGMKHGLLLMREAGHGGSIVNISSVAGLRGAPMLAGYCASKGAVRLMTKAVALECAAARDGVRVNSVHPGIIETPIWLGIVDTGGANAPPDLDAISTMAVPLGVKGVPEDIANGVLWLAGDESRYVTGTELIIDGGMTAR